MRLSALPGRLGSGLPALVLVPLLVLVACDTAEERAEGHYQRGMAFLEEDEKRTNKVYEEEGWLVN
jgi:hypothetical protein